MATTWQVPVIGILSTLSMDLLSSAAIFLGLIRPLPPNLVGRWFASVARAQPLHADIAHASPVNHEFLIALPAHYTIGIALTMLYVWGTGQLGWPRSFGVALGFGLCTNVLPWLLMFPAMGYGFFGAHGPQGTRLFVSSLISHACFGLGLWMAVRVIGAR